MVDSFSVTLDVYCGWSNPVFDVPLEHACELSRQIVRTPRRMVQSDHFVSDSWLGYRGYLIRARIDTDLQLLHKGFGDWLVSYATDGRIFWMRRVPGLHKALLEAAPPMLLAELRVELQRFDSQVLLLDISLFEYDMPPLQTVEEICGAFPYDSAWAHPSLKKINNCYNFAVQKLFRTGTNAIPGWGHGNSGLPEYRPDLLMDTGKFAEQDGLIPTGANDIAPPGSTKVALALSVSTNDFHWYRYSSDQRWWNKRGQLPPCCYDAARIAITDPQNCDRGIYDCFAGYFLTNANTVDVAPRR